MNHSQLKVAPHPITEELTPSLSSKRSWWKLSHLGFILSILMLMIPLSNLPPVRIGYYSQVEPTLIAFWGLSSISCLWFSFLWKKNPQLVYQTSKLPLVWGPILLGIFTILSSVFHRLPLRDFVGSGQIGDGALTFIGSGIIAAHFSIVSRISLYRRTLFALAVCVGLTICTLTIIGSMDSPFLNWRYWIWASFYFPDFLAFIDIALLATYVYMRPELKSPSFIKMPYLYDFITISVFGIIMYYANNKSFTYGLVIALLSTLVLWQSPVKWRLRLMLLGFFGLNCVVTLIIVSYDNLANILPESLKFLTNLSTITSRTWLSKISLIDLFSTPIDEHWAKNFMIGHGWGTFSNLSTANMFLIDQINMFVGKTYQPNWELINRDLMHTHNVLTSTFHSLGLAGVAVYMYTQYKLIQSLSRPVFLTGAAFLIAYQIQLLFWFEFVLTIPFSLLAMSLFFRNRCSRAWPSLLKPKVLLGYGSCLLIFALLQSFISIGYSKGLMFRTDNKSNADKIDILVSAPYVQLESLLGAQRQIGMARIYSIAIQNDFKDSPQKLARYSLKLVNYLNSLPKGGNYLANTLAINILSELADNPNTLKYLDANAFRIWEQLVEAHVTHMPYRSDILLPFLNLYQKRGKDQFVLELVRSLTEKNQHDAIAFWFRGSTLLKEGLHFHQGMCLLHKSIEEGIERFMPVPPPLKTKIITQAKQCPKYY